MSDRVGSGRRFAGLEATLAGRPGVKNPRALAAAIGRRKYGSKRMAALAAAGKRRADDAPGEPAAPRRVRV